MKISNSGAYDKLHNKYITDSEKDSEKHILPKSGDLIKGEIIDVLNKNIKIKLSNGQIIDAKVLDQFDFFIGQKIRFIVKESNALQIILKPELEVGNETLDKLIQVLENAGLSVNEENINVVSRLIENQMPIDKETLTKIIPYSKQFSGEIDQILFLIKNNIPITKENIEQLNNMLKNDNKIIQSLAEFIDDLSILAKDNFTNEIVKILLKDNPEAKDILNFINNSLNNSKEKNVNFIDDFNNANLSNQELLDALNVSQNYNQESKVSAEAGSQEPNIKNELINEILSNKEIQLLEFKASNIIKQENPELKFNLANKSIEDIFNELNSLEISIKLKEQIKNIITERISYALFSKEILANKTHLENPEELNEFYNKLYTKIKSILEFTTIKEHENKPESLIKEANQIKSSLEFMNALNQKFNYIQLPMLFGDKMLHSELYVFNNKRQLKNAKATITALVRLDLVNLGHLDIYITKTEKNLTINFYTEDDSKTKIIQNKIYEVHNQLSKLGFKILALSVSKKEKDFNVVDDFLKKEEGQQEIKRYTFDMRV